METRYRTISAMFMTILTLSSILVLCVPQEAEAQQAIPEISAVVNPAFVLLDVSPRGTGLGQTTATITNSGAQPVRVRVVIDAPGYQVSPQFATITVNPSSSQNLPIAIAATLRTPYRQAAATVFAEVTHVGGVPFTGVSEAQAGFLVQSVPYGKVILQSDKPFQKVSPGKEYPFRVRVVNNGNSLDSFQIEVTNSEELQKKGFSISLSSTTTKNIDPTAYDLITIQMQTPREFGWKNEYYNLAVRAVSEIDATQRSDYTVTIWVYGFGVAGFEPLYSIFALAIIASVMARRKRQEI